MPRKLQLMRSSAASYVTYQPEGSVKRKDKPAMQDRIGQPQIPRMIRCKQGERAAHHAAVHSDFRKKPPGEGSVWHGLVKAIDQQSVVCSSAAKPVSLRGSGCIAKSSWIDQPPASIEGNANAQRIRVAVAAASVAHRS